MKKNVKMKNTPYKGNACKIQDLDAVASHCPNIKLVVLSLSQMGEMGI